MEHGTTQGPAPVAVGLEWTPNPSTIKLVVNRALLPRPVNFTTRDSAAPSPLALRLFAVPAVSAVMIGTNFVTLTKTEEGDWVELHDGAVRALQEHLGAGLAVYEGDLPATAAPSVAGGDAASGAAGERERLIREILDSEIRPAVAMDGGDITFDRYEDDVLYLHMKGSCHGCPSSTMTLRMGIEERIRQVIPELSEVVAV